MIKMKQITKGKNTMNQLSRHLLNNLRRLANVAVAIALIVGVSAVSYEKSAFAAQCSSGCVATMSASPASGSYNPGNTVTVSVYVNSGGQGVNAVQADFTYSSSLLQFQSINAAGSAFGLDASSTGGNGSVSIARGNTSGISGGSLLVAQVSFLVLNSTGTATIGFINGSSEVNKADGQGTNILGSTSGASYSVVNPTPPPTQQNQQPSSPTYIQPGPTPSTGTYTKPAPTSSQPTTSPSPTATPTATTTDQPKTTTTTNTPKPTATKKTNSWLMPALITGGVVVVGAGGAGAWLMLRRRHSILPVTGGSVPTSDFITGSGSSMPPVQPPVTPVQPHNPAPTAHHDDMSDPYQR